MKKTRDTILVPVFSALICLGAYIKIPVPGLPFTLQTFFVTLAGLLLGAKRGALSALMYVFIGLCGLPVFTQGGGASYVFRPSFGYLIGFCVAAYVIGKFAHSAEEPSFGRLLFASFAGFFVIYIIGMAYYYMISTLYLSANISFRSLLIYCFLLTAPGDVLLCIFASLLAKRLLPIIKRYA